MQQEVGKPYVLGLDLGVASIGWALAECADSGRIIRAGVHLFEAGIDGGKQDPETAMATGREKSRAAPRRDARQQRRQIWRRAYRKRVLLKALIRYGLLPKPERRLDSPAEIDSYLKDLDAQLRECWEVKQNADHRMRQLLPYRLRAEALCTRLEPREVGRALYHLAQRRGFLSNRKTDRDDAAEDDANTEKANNRKTDQDDAANDDSKNTGKVKAGIRTLGELLNGQTLGQYFASIDPNQLEHGRIRGRYTGRAWYEDEFERIWAAQAKHHPSLMTDEAKAKIHRAIFYQRPLKSQAHLIGRCSLIPEKRRAPLADRLVQRFRMLQKINDLQVIPHMMAEVEDVDRRTGEVKINPKTGKPKLVKRLVPDPSQKPRPLTPQEREAAIKCLSAGDATFTQLRKAGVAPNNSRFNFENDTTSKLSGMNTDEKLRSVFGERWDQLTEDQKNAVVEDCLSIERADAMEKRGREVWGLSPEQAKRFAKVKLEEGYSNLSRAAIRALLPLLESNESYATARKKIFPESFKPVEPMDFLPPLEDAFAAPVSPAVSRALSELRRVVNAIIRRYGKPAHVRIELARDLKKGRKHREAISRQIAKRQKLREKAAEQLLARYPDRRVTEEDKLKVLLADECGWRCPYTNRGFGWSDLFGPHPTIDIEHIWPFKRSLDDSFLNKTLCCVDENRKVKRDRMPSEAYAPDRLDEILQRVAKFRGDAATQKLERFRATSIPTDFISRHLSESQYISRKAAEYISLLYGGYSDDEHKRRVHVSSGGLTAWLRREWGMNAILSDRNEKERHDHRHHAIDAIIIAHTTPAIVKKLQESAARADDAGSRRRFAGVEPPFDLQDAKRAIEAIVVSHRQSRKARGKFHKDTIYSKRFSAPGRKAKYRIRKEIDKLNENELGAIVDPRIRAAVQAAYDQRKREGAKNPEQAFSEIHHRPLLPHGERIRRVRLFTRAKPEAVGKSSNDRKRRGCAKLRNVDLQANHHTVIMAKLNKDGSEKSWVDKPVSLFEAMNRVKEGKPLISREVPEGYRFKFSLAKNEFLRFVDVKGFDAGIYRVLRISENDIECASHTDGRTSTERQRDGARVRLCKTAIAEGGFEKVHITYLGEVKNAGG